MKTRALGKVLVLAFVMGLVAGLPGCRRAPAKETVLYESERRALAELAAKPKEEVFIRDGYPWEGRNRPLLGVAERITAADQDWRAQDRYLSERIHGPGCPAPLPERCPHCHCSWECGCYSSLSRYDTIRASYYHSCGQHGCGH